MTDMSLLQDIYSCRLARNQQQFADRITKTAHYSGIMVD